MPAYKFKDTNRKKPWYVAYYITDFTGKRIKKKKEGFATKKEAVMYEASQISSNYIESEELFGNLIKIYLEDKKARVKETTYNTKEYIIKLKILPILGGLKISDITPSVVREWQNKLLMDKKNYSQTYMKTINNQLSAIFNYAVSYHGIKSNPIKITGSIGKKHASEMKFWTPEEFYKFSEMSPDRFTTTVMFEILFWSGIRLGELLALTLDDFDFEKKILYINKTYSRIKKKDIITDPKTPKSIRRILIPNRVINFLQEYVSKLYSYESFQRLFSYTGHYLRHEMKRRCKKLGVDEIRIHDLRHSHASLLINLNFTPLLIAERLGHENVQTTLNIYGHLFPTQQEKLLSTLEEINEREETKKLNMSNM